MTFAVEQRENARAPGKAALRVAVDEPVVGHAVEPFAPPRRIQPQKVVAVQVGVGPGEFAKCAELVKGSCHGDLLVIDVPRRSHP
jgi:hypothetical protein